MKPVDLQILRAEVGSGAHGTGLAGHEDHDETIVRMETAAEVLGIGRTARAYMERTKPNGVPSGPEDTDRQVYTLRHFLHLATNGNPSIMMVLWAPVIEITPLGEELRALAPRFIGRHLVAPYRGYMQAQKDRLLGLRGGRHGAFRETDAGYDTKYAMHAARLGFQGIELLTNGGLELPIRGAAGTWLRDVRRGKVPLDFVVDRIAVLDHRLEEIGQDEKLPAGPDKEAIEHWSVGAHLRGWGWEPFTGLVRAARTYADFTHGNLTGQPYRARQEARDALLDALEAFD